MKKPRTVMVRFFQKDCKARGHINLRATAGRPCLDFQKSYFSKDALYFRVNRQNCGAMYLEGRHPISLGQYSSLRLKGHHSRRKTVGARVSLLGYLESAVSASSSALLGSFQSALTGG